jgi:hypothetical protein
MTTYILIICPVVDTRTTYAKIALFTAISTISAFEALGANVVLLAASSFTFTNEL